jgi:hypothetical protein
MSAQVIEVIGDSSFIPNVEIHRKWIRQGTAIATHVVTKQRKEQFHAYFIRHLHVKVPTFQLSDYQQYWCWNHHGSVKKIPSLIVSPSSPLAYRTLMMMHKYLRLTA